jgi:hypothetical protein
MLQDEFNSGIGVVDGGIREASGALAREAKQEGGLVRVNEGWTKISFRDRVTSFAAADVRGTRPFAKNAKERGTLCVGDARKIKSLGHTAWWDCPSYFLCIQTRQVSGPASLFVRGRPASLRVSLI